MRLILRITMMLIGFLTLWTGLYAAMNFNPPAGADPGAINACWATFTLMIICGPIFVWSSTWRLGKGTK